MILWKAARRRDAKSSSIFVDQKNGAAGSRLGIRGTLKKVADLVPGLSSRD